MLCRYYRHCTETIFLLQMWSIGSYWFGSSCKSWWEGLPFKNNEISAPFDCSNSPASSISSKYSMAPHDSIVTVNAIGKPNFI
ncbi:hypothetical protein Lalb_Chr25g0281491 [Lupinus albus]|uniref:Uncharacterized protein n=1 Tax=Lupinus albus TaxID=3870 RepID=A0A6A4N3J6_LUPAL|nr:hypothetical protein Lalb_Chr25g0281491 [Lupinus albus]